MEDRQLALSEVAGLMGVSERTVRRWIKSGKLRAFKPGRDYRIPESAFREFVAESEISPKASRSSLEPSLFNGLEDEQREAAYDIALNAASDQARQDTQGANRAFESERPQPYFMRHENAAATHLLQYSADELAGALLEMARHVVELEAQVKAERERTSEARREAETARSA